MNVEILCANSSQAKGRVERANRTLQDRLVKELRLAGISDMEAGNAYLQGFKERFNAQFAKAPAKPDNLRRALNVEPDRPDDVLCWRDTRYVGKQLTFSYDRKRIMLEESDVTRSLVGKYVDTYAFVDGRFEVRSKGRSLPHKIFDMDQRVTHAAITDNKRLGAVLEHIKDMQDKARQNIPSGQILRRWATNQIANAPADLPAHVTKRRLCKRQNKPRIDAMNAEEEPEIIMSDLCADVEVDGHFLTVDIYKSDIDPGWILEVINEFGTSTVFDDPFLTDGLAWQQFEKTLNEEGLTAFLTKKEKRQLFH